MAKKRFILKPMLDVRGRPFRIAETDDIGNPLLETRKDSDGKPIMQVPRNEHGEPVANAQPETVHVVKTRVLEKDALPELLKAVYLRIPGDKLTRQDTIYGTRLFQNINDAKDGVLELDDDVHDWIKKVLAREITADRGSEKRELGLLIYGIDLYVIEQALEGFERLHEPKAKDN